MNNKLILFDVNGIFGLKVDEATGCDIIKLPRYYFKLRPGIKDFLDKFECQVGVFSSTNYSNVAVILSHIDSKYKFRFNPLMDRAMTTFDPEIENYETIKLLSNFWDNPVHNRDRIWNSTNTLLVDNSTSKVRFNDSKNVLVVNEYNPDGDDDLDDLYNQIIEKLVSL